MKRVILAVALMLLGGAAQAKGNAVTFRVTTKVYDVAKPNVITALQTFNVYSTSNMCSVKSAALEIFGDEYNLFEESHSLDDNIEGNPQSLTCNDYGDSFHFSFKEPIESCEFVVQYDRKNSVWTVPTSFSGTCIENEPSSQQVLKFVPFKFGEAFPIHGTVVHQGNDLMELK